MNLTVIGATGRTGSHVLTQARERGHAVTAFTRQRGRLDGDPRAVRVVVGDGRDPTAVREAVSGAQAVIAIVAPDSRTGPFSAAAVAEVLVEAMTRLGVRRLLVTSAYPIVAREPRLPLAILRRIFAGAYADAAAMERLVAASRLDWTIARLNRLTDRSATGGTRVSRDLLRRPTALTRADAAASLLELLEDSDAIRMAYNIAGPA
jgi:putative NADH-flavin reductase